MVEFHDNVNGLLTEQAARELEGTCWDLEKLPNLGELGALLASARPV